MKKIKLIFFIIVIFQAHGKAQYGPLLLDKPDIFKVICGSVYGMSDNHFTKAETDANYKKLCAVAEVIHQNPVMSNLKGFDCDVSLDGSYFKPLNGYGIPCYMQFMFRVWFLQNGKEVRWNVEAPHWNIDINIMRETHGGIFDLHTNYASTKTNPNYTSEKWEKAGANVRELFQVNKNKETLARGIDRYGGEKVIIYNPDREPYWIPVTVREAFDLVLAFHRLNPDQAIVDAVCKMLEDEYASFSEPEKDMYAYFSPGKGRGILGISNDSTGDPIMRANPAYWNKSLPKSAIQILSFYDPADKNYLRNKKEQQLKDNDGEYHISRFVEGLDINTLVPLIDK